MLGLCDLRWGTYGVGRDVREISGDTWSVHNIIEGELVDEGTELEEQGQRLSKARVTVSIALVSYEIASKGYKPVRYRQRHQRQLFEAHQYDFS